MHLCSGCLEAASFLWGWHRLGSQIFFHQSLLCFVISLFSLWDLFRIRMLCLVPCVNRFVFLLQYCLHGSWFQRTVGSLLLPMRMTNHIRIWQLIHGGWCAVMFSVSYHYLVPESVREPFRPVDRTVTCPVHSNFLSSVDHMHMFLWLANVNIWISVKYWLLFCKFHWFWWYHQDMLLTHI